jgi:hypothetical protein
MRTNTETSPDFLKLGQHFDLGDNLYELKTVTSAFIVISFDDLPFFKYFILNYVILLSQSQFFVFGEITGISLEKYQVLRLLYCEESLWHTEKAGC